MIILGALAAEDIALATAAYAAEGLEPPDFEDPVDLIAAALICDQQRGRLSEFEVVVLRPADLRQVLRVTTKVDPAVESLFDADGFELRKKLEADEQVVLETAFRATFMETCDGQKFHPLIAGQTLLVRQMDHYELCGRPLPLLFTLDIYGCVIFY